MGLLSIEIKAWYGISYNPVQLWTLKYLIKKLKLWTHRKLRWIEHRELRSCVSNQRRAKVDNHSKVVLWEADLWRTRMQVLWPWGGDEAERHNVITERFCTHMVKEPGGADTLRRSAACTWWILEAAGNEQRRQSAKQRGQTGNKPGERKRDTQNLNRT